MLNKRSLSDKTLLALESECRRLQNIKHTKVPVDPPIQRGWKRCYFLSASAKLRPAAHILEAILNKINVTRKHWRRDFAPTERNRRQQIHHLDQPLLLLCNYNFGHGHRRLPEASKAYFIPTLAFEDTKPTWKLGFRFPEFFELRIVPNLQTEVWQMIPDVEMRLAELDQKLVGPGWARLSRLHGYRKDYQRLIDKQRTQESLTKKRIRAAYAGDFEAEKSRVLIPCSCLPRVAHRIRTQPFPLP